MNQCQPLVYQTMLPSTLIIAVLPLFPVVSAQFHFFDNMWGQHQQQQQQPSGASQWAAYHDSVRCASYLCPQTLECVLTPADCPCPAVEDIKCTIPDAVSKGASTVVCVRGRDGCAQVEKLMKKRGW